VVWRKYHGGTAVEEVIDLAQRLSIPFRAFDGGSRLVSLYTQVSLMECDRSRPMVITLIYLCNTTAQTTKNMHKRAEPWPTKEDFRAPILAPPPPATGGSGDFAMLPPHPSPPIGCPYSVLALGTPVSSRPPHPKMGNRPALDLFGSPSPPADMRSIFAVAQGGHRHLVGVASQAIEAPPAAGV